MSNLKARRNIHEKSPKEKCINEPEEKYTSESEEDYIKDLEENFTSESESEAESGSPLRKRKTNLNVENEESNIGYRISIILSVAIICIACFYQNSKSELQNVDINELKIKFPNQSNETWDNIEVVIEDILQLNPTHPAVFLILYEKETTKINELVDFIAKYSSQKLNTNDFFIAKENEFQTKAALKDYGILVEKFKPEIVEKQVMVVRNLQKITGKVAQVFHSLCDEISPLVEKAVYLFTLKVDSINGKAERIAEESLIYHWRDLDNDILMPLITRVTSTVLKAIT